MLATPCCTAPFFLLYNTILLNSAMVPYFHLSFAGVLLYRLFTRQWSSFSALFSRCRRKRLPFKSLLRTHHRANHTTIQSNVSSQNNWQWHRATKSSSVQLNAAQHAGTLSPRRDTPRGSGEVSNQFVACALRVPMQAHSIHKPKSAPNVKKTARRTNSQRRSGSERKMTVSAGCAMNSLSFLTRWRASAANAIGFSLEINTTFISGKRELTLFAWVVSTKVRAKF